MRLFPAFFLLSAACGHSEPFGTAPTGSGGPFSTGTPIRLTYNSGTDSAASWTEDGKGLIYLYSPGGGNGDRCIGLIPPGGGTQGWQLCDSRTDRADSAKSFSAPALASNGRLIYLQALARRGRVAPDQTLLWLADSATPFVRRAVISFPTNIGGRGISWLSDAQWVATDDFVARAGDFSVGRDSGGAPLDTTITAVSLVRGTITASGATLALIAGTEDAPFHALAEAGASVVLMRDNTTVLRVATTGGTPTIVATLPAAGLVTGIGCRGSECVVTLAVDRVLPATGLDTRFYRVRLATNTIQEVRVEAGLWAGPLIAPTGGDVVVQSSTGPTRDLYLFKGLLP